MHFEPTPIPGAFLIRPKVVADERGTFVKSFHDPAFQSHGIEFHMAESFYSTSSRGVLRGMHFQVPPASHEKLVYCTAGRVLDVLLDLRKDSPTAGQFFSKELSEENRLLMFVPVGVAHGFLALEDESTLVYAVTTAHDPACDCGVRWDSFGMNWPIAAPLISPRDEAFVALRDFTSPFDFQP